MSFAAPWRPQVRGHARARRPLFVLSGWQQRSHDSDDSGSERDDHDEHAAAAAAADAPADSPAAASRPQQQPLGFSDVVDADFDDKFESYINDDLVGGFVNSAFFRMLVLALVMLNTAVIGLQTDPSVVLAIGSVMNVLDVVFLTVFMIEIGLKWFVSFAGFWRSGWNVFDFAVVALSLLTSASFVNSSRVLRVFRVFRAFRALRSISALRGLQIVVQTVFRSIPDIANVIVLLLIVMFVFGITGVSLFGAVMPERFGSLGDAMFALFVCVTQDGWIDYVEEFQAVGYFSGGAAYLAIFIVIGAFVLANLMVGIVVTNLQQTFHEIRIVKSSKNRRLNVRRRANRLVDIVRARHVDPEALQRGQAAVVMPSWHGMPAETSKTIALLREALRENTTEFNDVQMRLDAIVERVREANLNRRALSIDDDDENDANDGADADAGLDAEALGRGDVLTEMILRARMEERAAERRRQTQHKQAVERAARRARIARELQRTSSSVGPGEFVAAAAGDLEPAMAASHMMSLGSSSTRRRLGAVPPSVGLGTGW